MNDSIEIYRSQDGSIQLNVKLENDTAWLTQSQMAELFGVDRTSIVRHIRRNRQTLWGGCTDANPKLLLNDT